MKKALVGKSEKWTRKMDWLTAPEKLDIIFRGYFYMSTKRKYTQYSREEKLDEISKILSGSIGIAETSRLLNVASSSVKLWVSKFKLYGEASLKRRYSVNNRDFKISVIMDIVNNGSPL